MLKGANASFFVTAQIEKLPLIEVFFAELLILAFFAPLIH